MGSDHIPILIILAAPYLNQKPRRPRWADPDWETLGPIVKGFIVPAAQSCPSPPQLDEWMSESRNRLVARLKEHWPVSRPSHHSKPWWTPHLSILRREYHKAARAARKHYTPRMQEIPAPPRLGILRQSRPLRTNTGPPFYWGPPPRAFRRLRCSPTGVPSGGSPPFQGQRPHYK